MPYLPMYISGSDIQLVLKHLEEDSEVAFIVSEGPRRFRAQRTAAPLTNNEYLLWHVPTGPLPEFMGAKKPDRWIVDPFAGWEQTSALGPDGLPSVGAHQVTIMQLWVRPTTNMTNVWHGELGPDQHFIPRPPDPNGYGPPIGISSLCWTGNYWNILGAGALETTERWWQRFRRWTKKNARRVPSFGPLDQKLSPLDGAYAFPQALAEIRRGRFRGVNPA